MKITYQERTLIAVGSKWFFRAPKGKDMIILNIHYDPLGFLPLFLNCFFGLEILSFSQNLLCVNFPWLKKKKHTLNLVIDVACPPSQQDLPTLSVAINSPESDSLILG